MARLPLWVLRPAEGEAPGSLSQPEIGMRSSVTDEWPSDAACSTSPLTASSITSMFVAERDGDGGAAPKGS